MIKEGSKYYPLYIHLEQSEQDTIALTMPAIEALLEQPLPASARQKRAWWSNRTSGAVQATAWMDAGYHVIEIDLAGEQIIFQKPGIIYDIQRDGNIILWDSELIKAFRHFMGLSQAQLADRLQVRQQTISEWETGAYKPKRSTSQYLSLFAENAGFTYGQEN